MSRIQAYSMPTKRVGDGWDGGKRMGRTFYQCRSISLPRKNENQIKGPRSPQETGRPPAVTIVLIKPIKPDRRKKNWNETHASQKIGGKIVKGEGSQKRHAVTCERVTQDVGKKDQHIVQKTSTIFSVVPIP